MYSWKHHRTTVECGITKGVESMYTIQIAVRCSDEYTEVLRDEQDNAACLIEEGISLLLLQWFSTVLVDNVHIAYTPSEDVRGDLLSPAV
jgi:hypothetical protein